MVPLTAVYCSHLLVMFSTNHPYPCTAHTYAVVNLSSTSYIYKYIYTSTLPTPEDQFSVHMIRWPYVNRREAHCLMPSHYQLYSSNVSRSSRVNFFALTLPCKWRIEHTSSLHTKQLIYFNRIERKFWYLRACSSFLISEACAINNNNPLSQAVVIRQLISVTHKQAAV
jgi:hypothetical protein